MQRGWTKIIAVLLTVMLITVMAGCGKKSVSFKVDKEKLPKGVVHVKTPLPNKALMIGEFLTQEALRRYVTAYAYTQAVTHYDFEKGNAKDFAALARKMKTSWQSAKDAASLALFYDIKLSEMSRRTDYKRYAMADTGSSVFVKTAYAAKKSKEEVYNSAKTKEEIYATHSKSDIKKYLESYPEEKQLCGLAKVLQTNGKTACEIMKDVYPEKVEIGSRSWGDIGYDIAYRGANVAKTAGKAAGLGIAVLMKPATGGASMAVATGVGFIKLADTVADVTQTTHVLINGEENKAMQKVLSVTEKADAIAGILTFNINAESISKSLTSSSAELAKMARLGDANNITTAIQLNNITSTGASVLSYLVEQEQQEACLVVKGGVSDDGRETRTAIVPTDNLGSEETKAILAAMDDTPENVQKDIQAIRDNNAVAATATSEEYATFAEEVAKAGDGAKNGEALDKVIGSTVSTLAATLAGSGVPLEDVLLKMATAELANTAVIVVDNPDGNKTAIVVPPQAKTATKPYAIENIVGKYHTEVVYKSPRPLVTNQTEPIDVVFEKASGGNLKLTFTWYSDGDGGVKAHTETEIVTHYDPATGVGRIGKYEFRFSGTKGNMHLSVTGP